MSWKAKITAYDEQALVDLTSVGLLRRARKQVEAGTVRALAADESESQGIFAVNDQTVVLPDGPLTEAGCDCRAVGLCVHILAAVLFARQSPAPDEAEPSPAPEKTAALLEKELQDLTPQKIFTWAGKPALRTAVELLARLPGDDRRTIPGDTSLEIVLGDAVRCRYVQGAGLQGVICDAPDHRRKGVIAACLLHWRQQGGDEIPWPEDLGGGQTGSVHLSEDEKQLTHAIREHLAGMLRAGLIHLPRHMEDTLRDLAWSARGGRLPRLSALALQLVGEMTAFRKGRTGTGSGRVFDLLVHVYVLCEALARSPVEAMAPLRGRFRRDYHPRAVGPLWMVGAGKYETRSGAKGLNLVFWDLANNRPLQVNCGRSGEAARGFDPAEAWKTVLGWQKGCSPQMLNNKVLQLENAKVSQDGRLSLSGETLLKENTDPQDQNRAIETAGYHSWDQLCRDLAAELQKPQPAPGPLLVRPSRITPLVLEEISQQWTGWVRDQAGQWLRLTLPVSDSHARRAEAFNRCVAACATDIRGVVLVCGFARQRLRLLPVSLIVKTRTGFTCLHPDLEFYDIKQQLNLTSLIKRLIPKKQAAAPELPPVSPYAEELEGLIRKVQDMILGAAEVGLACDYLEREQTAGYAATLESGGAPRLARLVGRLGAHKDPTALIQAHYALQMIHRQIHIHGLVHQFDEDKE